MPRLCSPGSLVPLKDELHLRYAAVGHLHCRDEAGIAPAVERAALEASAKAAEIRERNDEQLERDKLRMKEELKGELSELVARAAESVVGKVLTDAQRGELADIASRELKK